MLVAFLSVLFLCCVQVAMATIVFSFLFEVSHALIGEPFPATSRLFVCYPLFVLITMGCFFDTLTTQGVFVTVIQRRLGQ